MKLASNVWRFEGEATVLECFVELLRYLHVTHFCLQNEFNFGTTIVLHVNCFIYQMPINQILY